MDSASLVPGRNYDPSGEISLSYMDPLDGLLHELKSCLVCAYVGEIYDLIEMEHFIYIIMMLGVSKTKKMCKIL